jgi:hypothetical protein
MRDVVLVAAVLVFFAVCIACVRACDWIMGSDVTPPRTGQQSQEDARSMAGSVQ